jgi:hypothetical protein
MKHFNDLQIIKKLKSVNLATKVLFFGLLLIFIFSLLMFFLQGYAQRRVFLFESLDKPGLFAENRYYPRNKYIDNVELYISELLLGPIGERYKLVYPRGTKLNTCFVQDKVLYVDLSAEALFTNEKVSTSRDGAEIFKKNIFRNFRNIDTINIYIDGRKIFDD